ncbi:MAG: phosphotriesterase, partial [Verrucomicrobiota bacterium]
MGIDRRTFLAGGAALLTGAAVSAGCAGLRRTRSENIIMTVGGAIAPRKLGKALTHEHVLVDFIGAEQVNRSRYQSDEVFAVALPHLRRVRELGCESLFECTPAYIGRDPVLLRRLSEATGLNLITNIGYYGAGQNKYLPAHARSETADALAARWIREWHEG